MKSSQQNPPVLWLMTDDDAAAYSVVVPFAYVALGSRAISHMGNMLYSHLSTRAATMQASEVADWSEMNLPYLTLVVDEGIDIGDLADAIAKRGRLVGVSLVVRSKEER